MSAFLDVYGGWVLYGLFMAMLLALHVLTGCGTGHRHPRVDAPEPSSVAELSPTGNRAGGAPGRDDVATATADPGARREWTG